MPETAAGGLQWLFFLKVPVISPGPGRGGRGVAGACKWLSFHLVKFHVHPSLPLSGLAPLWLCLAEQFRL